MKYYLTSILLLFFISSCSTKVDQSKAKAMAESLLNDLKTENYSNLNKYYTDISNESEPLDAKIEKYKKIKETAGAIESYELISSNEKYDSDRGLNELELKYKVKCTRVPVQYTFLVINDEGNDKIIFQNIENLPSK